MKKILRKLLALNLTVIMLLAMMVPAMAGENGVYWFNVLDKDKGPGYYKVTYSLPEDVKVYEAFCMGYWVACSLTGGANFLHSGTALGDELPPMPNAYIAPTVITGGANVYYLDTMADNRAGKFPGDKLWRGYEWCYEQKYAAENKVTYERIEPTLNNYTFTAAPKGAYVYRSDVEFTYSDNNTDSSDANESYVIYRGRTPIKKTFFEGKGWLYVLEANTDYYVVKDNGYFAGAAPFINPFTDVAEGQYYYDPVMWAVQKGITTGTSATTFEPKKPCSRAEVVTFLWRAKGKPAPVTNDIPFSDVKAGAWYTDAVLWAVENGVTNGTSDTTFSPNKVCTRAEVVTFLKRAVAPDVEEDEKVESESFDGYSNSNPAKLGALKAEGTGYNFDSTDGQLMPVFDSITAYDQDGNALSDTVDSYGFYSKPSLYRDDMITSAPEIGQKYYSGLSIDLDNIGGWEFTTEDIEIKIPGFECKVYFASEREMGSYMTIIYEAVAVETKPAEPAFADVPDGKWYTEAVLWAVEKGITTGTGDGKFSPTMVCDRAQIVTFLSRAIKR